MTAEDTEPETADEELVDETQAASLTTLMDALEDLAEVVDTIEEAQVLADEEGKDALSSTLGTAGTQLAEVGSQLSLIGLLETAEEAGVMDEQGEDLPDEDEVEFL